MIEDEIRQKIDTFYNEHLKSRARESGYLTKIERAFFDIHEILLLMTKNSIKRKL